MTVLPGTALAATRTDARHDDARNAGALGAAGDDAQDGEAVVVHVRDARSGEMDVYRGTSHVRVTDRDLAARLARASR
jgi:nitrogen fixation protein FixH